VGVSAGRSRVFVLGVGGRVRGVFVAFVVLIVLVVFADVAVILVGGQHAGELEMVGHLPWVLVNLLLVAVGGRGIVRRARRSEGGGE
jgi:hypothetical protein